MLRKDCEMSPGWQRASMLPLSHLTKRQEVDVTLNLVDFAPLTTSMSPPKRYRWNSCSKTRQFFDTLSILKTKCRRTHKGTIRGYTGYQGNLGATSRRHDRLLSLRSATILSKNIIILVHLSVHLSARWIGSQPVTSTKKNK